LISDVKLDTSSNTMNLMPVREIYSDRDKVQSRKVSEAGWEVMAVPCAGWSDSAIVGFEAVYLVEFPDQVRRSSSESS